MALDLRPLTLGELLDRSFGLFRRHFWLFVGLMALPSILIVLVNILVLVVPEFPDDIAEPNTLLMLAVMGTAVGVGLFVAYFVSYMVTLGATTVAVSELYVGRTATIASAYAYVRGHIGRLVLLMILIGLRLMGLVFLVVVIFTVIGVAAALVLGPLAAIIPVVGVIGGILAAFLFSLRYAVAVPAVVLEHTTAGQAVRRSVMLTRDNLFRTGVITVFAIVISYAALAVFQIPFLVAAGIAGPESRTGFWLSLVGTVTGAIGSAITTPLMIIALALLYYDLRIRKEGLDLQIMMANLDHTPPPDPAAPVPSAS
jgi:hypothetical protein